MSDDNEDKTTKAIVKGRISSIIPTEKPKPAEPTWGSSGYDRYEYGRQDDLFSYGRNRRRQAGLDDDLNDPVDDLYPEPTPKRPTWSTWTERDFMPEIPDFLRRSAKDQMNRTNFEPFGDRGQRNGRFTEAEIERLAGVLNRLAADLLQHMGIIWKSEASLAVKACLREQIEKNCLYQTKDRSYVEIKIEDQDND